MSIVSQELDYQSVELSHSSPVLTKITSQQPASNITSSGGQESIFEIPAKVLNFGKSYLSYKATPINGAQGASITNWRHLVPEISQLQLYTRQGMYLCDIPDFQTYWAVVGRKETSYDKLMSSDPIDANSGYFNWLHKTFILPDGNPAGSKSYRATASGTAAQPIKVPYHEAQSLIHGTIDTTGVNVNTPVLNVNLQFDIPNTIFMNKNQYFGESVYLRIVWSKSTDVLFTVNDANSDDNPVIVAPAPYNGDIQLDNLTFYLATETDPVVAGSVMQKFNSGSMSYKTDFVYMNTRSITGSATYHSLEVRYNRGQGGKLKKIYWAPMDNTNATNVKYDSSIVKSNGDRQRITSFYTTLNSLRIQQYDYDTPNGASGVLGNEWGAVRDKLKGSSILSSNEFYYHYSHVEDFTGVSSSANSSNLDDGLPLDQEQLYSIQATSPGADIRHVIYSVTSRDLVVTPAGITLI